MVIEVAIRHDDMTSIPVEALAEVRSEIERIIPDAVVVYYSTSVSGGMFDGSQGEQGRH